VPLADAVTAAENNDDRMILPKPVPKLSFSMTILFLLEERRLDLIDLIVSLTQLRIPFLKLSEDPDAPLAKPPLPLPLPLPLPAEEVFALSQ
jgi:hypothetical protein